MAAFEADGVEVGRGALALVFDIVNGEDDGFDVELFKKIFDEGGAEADVPVMEVENIDGLFLELEVLEGGAGEIDKAGGIVLAAIDLIPVEVAGWMARFEKAELTLF